MPIPMIALALFNVVMFVANVAFLFEFGYWWNAIGAACSAIAIFICVYWGLEY